MLPVGIAILAASMIGLIAANVRTKNAITTSAGEPWELDPYWFEGGPPRSVSQVAMLSWVGIVIGFVLVIVAIT
jgi:hypothetical protein